MFEQPVQREVTHVITELHVNVFIFGLNPLKLKLVQMIFKYSVHTSKKTQHFTITVKLTRYAMQAPRGR
jgi:hypothetical protein